MKCNRTSCAKDASWQAGFDVYDSFGDVPAKVELGLYLCGEHKHEAKIEDLVTNEGWDQIVEAFAGAGRAIPDRKRTKLAWKAIS